MSKLEKLCRLAGVGGILAALVMLPVLLAGTTAHAQDAFYVNYFANAQLGSPAQDDIIRIIDTNTRNATATGTNTGPYPLCAMVYVYDEFQEMQECCGCPVSAGGRLDLSVDGLTYLPSGDYVNNPSYGLPSLLYRGSIKIVSTNSVIAPIPQQTFNVPCPGSTEAVICDPTGDEMGGSWSPTPSLRAWSTHLQAYNTVGLDGSGNPNGNVGGYVTESRFERVDENPSDLTELDPAGIALKCSYVREINPSRGNCAAVCAAQGINPYLYGYYYGSTWPLVINGNPSPIYFRTQLGFTESEEGLPPNLCYTGY